MNAHLLCLLPWICVTLSTNESSLNQEHGTARDHWGNRYPKVTPVLTVMRIGENLPEVISVTLLTSTNYHSIFEAYMAICTFYVANVLGFLFLFFFCKACTVPSFLPPFRPKTKTPDLPSSWVLHSAVGKKRKKHIYSFLVWLGPLHPLISLLLDFHCSSRSLDGLSMITVMKYS